MNQIRFFNTQNTRIPSLYTFIGGAIAFFCILYFIQTNIYYPLVALLAIVAVPIIVIYPQSILYMFFISFFVGHHFWQSGSAYVDAPHFFFLMLILCFSSKYLFAKHEIKTQLTLSNKVYYCLFLFFLCVIFSFLLNVKNHDAREVFSSLEYVFNLASLLIALKIFSMQAVRNYKDKIINLVLLLSMFEIVLVLYQSLKLQGQSLEALRNITGTFVTHHSMLANMMVFPIGFLIYKVLRCTTVAKKIGYGLFFLPFLWVLVISGARGTIVGFFCAILILIALKLKLKLRHGAYLAMIALGLVLAVKFSPLKHIISNTLHSDQTGAIDVSTYTRFIIWQGAWDHFMNAPVLEKLFGVGIANMSTIQYPYFIIFEKHVTGAHNNLLHVLMETGIVGLIVFISFFMLVLVKLFRQSKNDHLALGYFFITLALLFSGIAQETFWFQPAFGLLWLYYMSLLGFVFNQNPDLEKPTNAF